MTEYRQVSIKKALVDKIEQFIKKHPEYGYKSIDDFLEDSVMGSIKKIRRILCLYTIVLVSFAFILTYLILFKA
ncbi:MAG: hypothetical protein QG670_2470 [Thermoproteota archaeon]|nr:hypothetical protein [Thermoproteota archaeon]